VCKTLCHPLLYSLIDRDSRLVDDGSFIIFYKYWIMVSHIITNQRGLADTAWTSTRSVGNQPRPPLPTQPSSCRWQGPRPHIHKSRKTSSEDIIRRHHRKTFGCVWKWMQPAIMRIASKHIYIYIWYQWCIYIYTHHIYILLYIWYILYSISYIIYKQLTIWSIWDCLKMRGTLTLNSWQV